MAHPIILIHIHYPGIRVQILPILYNILPVTTVMWATVVMLGMGVEVAVVFVFLIFNRSAVPMTTAAATKARSRPRQHHHPPYQPAFRYQEWTITSPPINNWIGSDRRMPQNDLRNTLLNSINSRSIQRSVYYIYVYSIYINIFMNHPHRCFVLV